MKIAAKDTNIRQLKIYYTMNAVMADIMNHWGNSDVLIQPFIRQKHIIKPSLIQYHMKSSNGVFKAISIVNKTYLDRTNHFYDRVLRSLLSKSRYQILKSYDK